MNLSRDQVKEVFHMCPKIKETTCTMVDINPTHLKFVKEGRDFDRLHSLTIID